MFFFGFAFALNDLELSVTKEKEEDEKKKRTSWKMTRKCSIEKKNWCTGFGSMYFIKDGYGLTIWIWIEWKEFFFFIRIHHRSSGQNDAWWLNTGQTNRISENITQKNSCNFLNFYCQKNKKLPVSFFHFIYLFGRNNFFLTFHFILFQSNIFIHIIDFLLDLFSLSFLVHVFFYFCIIVGTFGILSLKNHQWNQKYTIQIDRLNVICNFKIYKHLNG